MDLPAGILTLQRTDRWVGVPLCAILTLLRRIFECTGRPGPHQVRRILFVKFAEQGSTVLAYPAILRAIEMVGRENVYFVVFEDNRFILDAMEIIPEGNVITIATKSLFGLATAAMRAVLQVRKIGIDAVVDMEFLTRFSAILTFQPCPRRSPLRLLRTSQLQGFGSPRLKLLKSMPSYNAKTLVSVLRRSSCSTRTRATCYR